MIYLLDANTLIDAKRDYYPIDRIPEFWDWLVHKGRCGEIKIPVEIYEEFKDPKDKNGRKDSLAEWADHDKVRKALISSSYKYWVFAQLGEVRKKYFSTTSSAPIRLRPTRVCRFCPWRRERAVYSAKKSSIGQLMNRVNRLLVAAVVLLGFGCSAADRITKRATSMELADLKGHAVGSIRFDFRSKCKIGIKSRTVNRSGRCTILLTSDDRLRFVVEGPFGSAVLIGYMDSEVIQLFDRKEKSFSHVENNERNRSGAFAGLFDLKVEELKEVLWGRDIERRDDGLEFRFENRRPVSVRKYTDGQQLLITYPQWQEVLGIDMPRIVLMEDRQQDISVKIVLTQIVLGTFDESEKLSLLKGCDYLPE